MPPRSGFSVHNSVRAGIDDRAGLERLARYLIWPPVSLDRLDLDESTGTATYRVKRSAKAESAGQEVMKTFDPRDLLARVLMHVAEPKAHLIRYYGEYAQAAQARRRRDDEPLEHGREHRKEGDGPQDDLLTRAERRAQRREWAQLIRRIYEVDPPLCARMSIAASASCTNPAALPSWSSDTSKVVAAR